jgi:type III secretion system chaperone SycN
MLLEEVIEDFGNSAGFRSLKTNANGVVNITIDGIGDLFIDEKYRDESGDCVFMYLMRTYEHANGELFRRALLLCDYQSGAEFLVNPVLNGDQVLGFAVKHQVETFNVNTLQKTIRLLNSLHDRLTSGIR